jgi:hypothetical protein
MKHFLAILFFACFAQLATAQSRGAQFKFVKESHDFGILKEGGEAFFEFAFTNTGNEPLIIDGVSASCGCTVPSFNHEPVLPNQRGTIKVKFDTHGKNGPFDKIVYVKSNVPTVKEKYELYIRGTVVPK